MKSGAPLSRRFSLPVAASVRDKMSAVIEARKHALMVGLIVAAFTSAAFLLIIGAKSLAWLAPFSIGVALVSYGSSQLRRAFSASRWNKTKGKVAGSSIGEVFVPGKYGGHMEYFPIVRFEYTTATGQFTSERFTIVEKDFRHPRRDRAEQLIRQYPQGASIEAYVSPSNPSLAVLRVGISPHKRSHYLACIVGGSLVTMASIILGLYA